MTCFNAKATPTNNIDYRYHINIAKTYLANYVWFISYRIIPQVIYNLGAETHTQVHILTIHIVLILENQAHHPSARA